MDSLSQFSRRKYFKKPPKQKSVEQFSQSQHELYASSEVPQEIYLLEGLQEVDMSLEEIILPTDSSEYNDTIITTGGEVIVCKVTGENSTKIFYHHDPQNGKKIKRAIPLEKVKYKSLNNSGREPNDFLGRKANHYAGLSFMFSLLPAWLGFFIPALIFADLAFKQFKAYPDKYYGKGFAVAGAILGFIGLAFALFTILVIITF